MGMFDDLRAYRKLLNKEMGYAAMQSESVWTKHLGFIGSGGANYPKNVNVTSQEAKSYSATGKPIEVLTNFMHEGGDTMEIPLKNPLTNKPIYAGTMLGNEEERKLTYKKVRIGSFRHGVVIRDSKMGEQRLKKPEVQKSLMKGAKEDLQEYFQRVIGYQPYLALLEGLSENLSASTTSVQKGEGLTKTGHPNFFVAGATTPTFSNTAATYWTNISAALDTITDTPTKRMSAKLIKGLVLKASQLKIRPSYKIGNRAYYYIVISQAAAYDLASDPDFIAAQQAAWNGTGEKAKFIQGEIGGVFFNAFIEVDVNMPAAHMSSDSDYDSTRGTVYFGNDNPYSNPIDTGTRKLAILVGAGAVACGYASPLNFEEENWDYKYKKTEAADMIVGFERADVIDYDGKYGTAGNLKENTSSLVLAHYGTDTFDF